jgi:hypothetical protein
MCVFVPGTVHREFQGMVSDPARVMNHVTITVEAIENYSACMGIALVLV